jgi:hypothetical protein
MRAEEYSERRLELEGWPANLVSYRIGETYYAQIDNVSPGARVARTSGRSREEAENDAIARATKALGRTRVHNA